MATVTSQTFSLLIGELDEEDLVEISEEIVKEISTDLIDKLESVGWTTTRNLLGPTEWRYDLTYDKFL